MVTRSRRLKISLMTHGVAVASRARVLLTGVDGTSPLTLADYASTSGITLRLPDDVWVNAPLDAHNSNFVTAPRHTLDFVDGQFVVRGDGMESPVTPIPVPSYHAETNAQGEPYTSYAVTHTDRVRISPVEGCAIACRFCDLPFEFRYRAKRVDGLVDAVGRALVDRVLPARHVLISGGLPRDSDFEWMQRVWESVPAAFPGIEVDVMMVPAPGLVVPSRLKKAGVSGLSINLEIWNLDVAAHVMPGKARIGRARWLEVIADAVATFGTGRVRSLLLVGIEPLDDTLRAVEALASLGCDPVLSPFRPDPATPMRSHRPPSEELLVEAWERGSEIVARHGVRLGPRCVPCMHNTLSFPEAP